MRVGAPVERVKCEEKISASKVIEKNFLASNSPNGFAVSLLFPYFKAQTAFFNSPSYRPAQNTRLSGVFACLLHDTHTSPIRFLCPQKRQAVLGVYEALTHCRQNISACIPQPAHLRGIIRSKTLSNRRIVLVLKQKWISNQWH